MLKKRGDGRWFYPVKQFVYDEAYYRKYVAYKDTETGLELNQLRCDLIRKYNPTCHDHLDVGIGAGAVVDELQCYGYDVNPAATKKLADKFMDLYSAELPTSISFFDSLEHIYNIDGVFSLFGKQIIIISIPIFGVGDITKWKHYREDEHYHYFTDAGFKKYINEMGFVLLEENAMEQRAGRVDINTYVIKRADNG